MMKVPQMFDEMITAREAFVGDAVAAGHSARKFRGADAMNGGLMAL
jgi:hypothetical protein